MAHENTTKQDLCYKWEGERVEWGGREAERERAGSWGVWDRKVDVPLAKHL